MKIKLNTMMSGPSGTFKPGSILEIPSCGISKEQADELIAGKYAELISANTTNPENSSNRAKIETAIINPPENTSNVNNKSSGKPELKHIGGGYYNVIDSDGNQVTEKPTKKAEAKKLIKELYKG